MVDAADRVLPNLRDLPVSIDNIDAAIVYMLAERFRCAARGTRSRRRSPWRPISHPSGQRGARRLPNIDDAAGLRELRSLQHANDRHVPDRLTSGTTGQAIAAACDVDTMLRTEANKCAPRNSGTEGERRLSPYGGREPMSKICKAVAAAALAATVTLPWAVTTGLPAAAEEQGAEQERQVCTPDVLRLCTAFIPDPNRITVCLQQNISNLTPACRVVMNGSVQQQ
jgi:chorismate mutase